MKAYSGRLPAGHLLTSVLLCRNWAVVICIARLNVGPKVGKKSVRLWPRDGFRSDKVYLEFFYAVGVGVGVHGYSGCFFDDVVGVVAVGGCECEAGDV